MKAECTYNSGRTYRIKGVKFEQGKTKLITDSATIRKCQQTAGFSVRVLEEDDKPAKRKGKSRRVREVVEAKSTTKLTTKDKEKGKSSSKADK